MKPNFFIVGAPRCGTTALSDYLRSHPNIYISQPKEPHYFAEDLIKNRRFAKKLEEYLSLFKFADSSHMAIGEASVFYLYSSIALQRIREFNPNAKIVVMIRNPIDLVYSLHSQLLYIESEDRVNFEDAWDLQDVRKLGQEIPPLCRGEKLLQYSEIGKLGAQIEKLFEIFPRCQILVINFERFSSFTKDVYEQVLTFLGVPSDGKEYFPRINSNKSKNPQPLSNQLRTQMCDVFRSDIEMLSSLLDSDFSHWVDNKSQKSKRLSA